MKFGIAMAFAALVALPPLAAAQELEPRSYSASPVGANFAGLSYGYSTGGVLFDPSIPVTDVHADINLVSIGYGRTLDIGGMQGLVTAGIPYAWGILTGKVGGVRDSMISRSGFGDLRTKLSLNFIGSPALTPQQFATRPAQPIIIGASILLLAPTGAYDPAHLINIGSNRWAFKPELGFSYNVDRKLYLDFYAGGWFFTDNTKFYTGSNTESEDPMLSLQLHVSYTFNTHFWAAIESTWYSGGSTHINGGPPSPRQDNSRLGVLLNYSITQAHAIKAGYNQGATATIGQNFSTYSIGYQYLWF